jgi:hypothetical protein
VKVDTNPPDEIECDANNAATLNERTPVVAAFKTGAGVEWTPAQLLLVNDEEVGPDSDVDPGVQSYYTQALTDLGISFDVCSTGIYGNVEPTDTDLAPYQNVVWFTGDSATMHTGPGLYGEYWLSKWLDQGGCFLISSQDYAKAKLPQPSDVLDNPTDFMKNYLGVSSVNIDDISTEATGIGPFAGLGKYKLKVPPEYPVDPQDPSLEWNFTDTLQPGPGAMVAFHGDAGDIGLFKMGSTYRTAYLAFPLEMLENNSDRQDVLRRFLETCRFNSFYLPLLLSH